MADILPDCIAAGIRFVDKYIDQRFLQCSQLRKVDRSDGRAIKGGEDYTIAACDLNDDLQFIRDTIFEEGNDGGVVGVYLLDIPRIHNPNDPVAEKFIETLSKVEEKAIFSCNVVKAITEYRWEPCFWYIVKFQLAPYVGFMLSYLLYVFCVMDAVEDARTASNLPETEKNYAPFPGGLSFL